MIDGFSRIDGKSGQIFLFNSSPLTIRKRLTLDEKIGITTDESFYLHILYCENTDTKNEALDFGGEYKKGNILEVTLPPYGALVVEMSERPGDESISKIPFYHALGNHDMDKACKADVLDTLDLKNSYYSFDCGNLHFVVLDGCYFEKD